MHAPICRTEKSLLSYALKQASCVRRWSQRCCFLQLSHEDEKALYSICTCRNICHLNKHTCYNIACHKNKWGHILWGITPHEKWHSLLHQNTENKAWAPVCADKDLKRYVWTLSPLQRGSGQGAGVMQAWAEINSHFPTSKGRQVCSVLCSGSRGCPSALRVNSPWTRIHCGGAVSADCGDRLLFSVCFHVEVRVLWTFDCAGSWVGVGFQCDTC